MPTFNQQSYRPDALPLFSRSSQQGHLQSAAFAGNTQHSDPGRWFSNQINTQSLPGSFRNALSENASHEESRSLVAVEAESKKRKYENTPPRDHSADYQSLESTNASSAAQEEEFGSLNRLIDRFIERAEKVVHGQQRLPNDSNFALTDPHLQSRLHHTLPDPTGRVQPSQAHLPSSIEPGYFQEVNNVDILHRPSPPALFPLSVTQRQNPNQLERSSALTTDRRLTSEIASSSEPVFPPRPLFLPHDSTNLSPYQCLLRQQLEFFAADWDDVAVIQGRNKPVVRKQVGLRCIHCAHIPIKDRGIGSTYFSARLDAIYQSAQNMAKKHLLDKCRHIPPEIRQQLLESKRSSAGWTRSGSKNLLPVGSGKIYWAEAAVAVGVIEDTANDRLEFRF